MKTKMTLKLGYGPIMPPIEDQLKEQGLKFTDPQLSKTFQFYAHAINTLMFADVLTDGEVDKAQARLHKKISAQVVAL